MHELSVTQHLLSVVLEHAEQAGAQRVTRIDLRIGALTGIVDESIQFYFDFVSRDTPAAGARLAFAHVPVRLRCRQCGAEFEPQERDWLCPDCSATGGEVVAGREFSVESIEVE
ncbi:MAG TPA: hydrogenase maturation nickel metallochaperone HypA [Anaerolineae bacterium]|nr:hydrogenase maturation nickel metallochaperone HypA [Anaerolineae bacterium]HOQ98368.1 hydrogenase maturation nickel metallochaperone HypA [Anaerolineae bacterium]HPL28688.1 hydrogenase maturation nickel metallochaperone HypA [Anaerolineae bacterium]